MTNEPAGPPNLKFVDIHLQEREEIEKRREKQSYYPEDRAQPTFVGMALSGGGIRSATFCLGFLQELHRLRLLRIFDYLSTVSGGGYLGGWWSAWLSRSEEDIREVTPKADFTPYDIHDDIGLLTKVSEAADPVSQELLAQLENDCKGRLFLLRLKRKKLNAKSSGLSRLLSQQLNTYITRHSPPDVATAGLKEAEIEKRRKELRWPARVRVVDTFPNELRNVFPPREDIEPHRARSQKEKASDGSRCAWEDPVHHLRLFANYLTPRKGILSADTWRAISTITRNLALTWLILLPLLIGVMLLGQAFFLLNESTRWAFINPNSEAALTVLFQQILIPVGVLLTSSIMMAIAWLLCNRDNSSSQDSTVQTTCMIALACLLVSAAASFSSVREWFTKLFAVKQYFFVSVRRLPPEVFPAVIQFRLIVAWIILTLAAIFFMWYWKLDERGFPPADPETLSTWKRDVRRGRFSRAQAKLLVFTAIVAAVLLLSWFSCFLAKNHLQMNIGWRIPFTLVPLLSAIGGSIFTALRATPMVHVDRSISKEPTIISKLIFAATPPLVVGVLAVIAACVSHQILVYYLNDNHYEAIRRFLKLAAILSIALCMGLALYEMQNLKWAKILKLAVAPIAFVCLLMINLNWAGQALWSYAASNPEPDWSLFLASACLGGLITVLVFRRVIPKGKWKWRLFRRLNIVERAGKGKSKQHLKILRKFRFGSALAALTLSVTLTLIGYLIGFAIYTSTSNEHTGSLLRAVLLTFVGLAGGVILFRLFVTRSKSGTGEDVKEAYKDVKADKEFKEAGNDVNAGKEVKAAIDVKVGNGDKAGKDDKEVSRDVIELYFFKDNAFGKRPEALWLVASISFTLPIAMMCVAHYVKGCTEYNSIHSFTQTPMLFPICIALLLINLMVLRSFVIQKMLVNKRPVVE